MPSPLAARVGVSSLSRLTPAREASLIVRITDHRSLSTFYPFKIIGFGLYADSSPVVGGKSAITLPAGYLGSSLIGALLIFCGFDIVASKIASLVLAACFLLTLWWGKKDWLTILTILLAVGLLVACWFIVHAEPLRFIVLFIGVMSSLYSVWDIVSLNRDFFCIAIANKYVVRRLNSS